MVKAYAPEYGEYDFVPSPTDEEGRAYYLSQEVWNMEEVCSLLSGLDPHWQDDPLERVRWEEAGDKVRRAVAAGALKPLSDPDETYFIPKDVAMWARRNGHVFPFTEEDLKGKGNRALVHPAVGDRKTQNLYKIIGILALQLLKKKGGGQRSVGALFKDMDAVAKSLEEELREEVEISLYGLGEKSIYEAIKKGREALKAK